MKKSVLLVLLFALSITATAQLAISTPQQAGFSAERLNRIHTVMKAHIAAGHLAGASGMIVRNGKVAFRGNWGEMKPDSIVRMYSMTKGVTGVAAMILYDEGK